MRNRLRVPLVLLGLSVALSAIILLRVSPTPRQATPAPDCPSTQSLSECLSDWGIRHIDDLPTVVSTLTEYTVSNREFAASGCHDTWHKVGEAAGERYDPAEALALWPYSCYGGFMHGLIWTAAPRMGIDAFESSTRAMCADFKNRPEVVYLDCWHGVGHGLAEVYAFPESMYRCEDLAAPGEEYEWCTWGAAESLADGFIKETETTNPLTEDLPGLCPGLSQGIKACFRSVIPMMYNTGWSFEKLYDYCAGLGTDLRPDCAYSAGQILGTLWVVDKIESSGCYVHPDLATHCAAGAGRYVGRVSEWGALELEVDDPAKLVGICPEFTGPSRSACDQAYEEIRALELSPEEDLGVTTSWKKITRNQ